MNDSTLKINLLRLTELRYQLLPTLFERLKGDDGALGQILQCHLFAEVILEELIKLALGRQAEAVLSVRLTFDQKLSIVSKLKLHEDWELLPDYVIGSLRKLNSLRNRLAHRYGEQVLEEQVRELFVGLEEELPVRSHHIADSFKLGKSHHIADRVT